MPRESSFGAVIFRQNAEIEYLLLRYRHGKFDFSRGHAKAGEKIEETVRREIKEETGIKDLQFIPGFREKTFWFYKREGKTFYKEAVFLLAKTATKEIKLSAEHLEYRWVNYDEAQKIFTFKNGKAILEKANKFLLNYSDSLGR